MVTAGARVGCRCGHPAHAGAARHRSDAVGSEGCHARSPSGAASCPYVFDQWDDLLLSGAFAPREVLLRGLTFEQVGARPAGAPHSIYQELWHVTRVLEMSLAHGRVALESWPHAEHFPASPAPAGEAEWHGLVAAFLAASRRAVELSHEPGWLDAFEPGYAELGLRWRDGLGFLAVHTAYHLGRVVLLRQLLGTWPPPRS